MATPAEPQLTITISYAICRTLIPIFSPSTRDHTITRDTYLNTTQNATLKSLLKTLLIDMENSDDWTKCNSEKYEHQEEPNFNHIIDRAIRRDSITMSLTLPTDLAKLLLDYVLTLLVTDYQPIDPYGKISPLAIFAAILINAGVPPAVLPNWFNLANQP